MSRRAPHRLLGILALAAVIGTGAACELFLDLDDSTPDAAPPPPPPTVDAGGPADAGGPDGGPDERFVRPADCDSSCCDACAMVGECTDSQPTFADCERVCVDSILAPNRDIECLAMRIYWIDEEGCASIVRAYRGFDPSDNGTGPQF